MKKTIDKLRAGILFISLCFIILGISLIMWPNTSMDIIIYFLGAIILVLGGFKLMTYLSADDEFKNKFDLLEGIVFILAGLMMIFFQNEVITILTYIFGAYLIFDGALNVQKGFDLKRLNYNPWKIVMPLGAITLVIGIIFICRPFEVGQTLVLMMGVALVYDGIMNLYIVFCLKHARSKFNEEYEVIEEDDVELIEEKDNEDE